MAPRVPRGPDRRQEQLEHVPGGADVHEVQQLQQLEAVLTRGQQQLEALSRRNAAPGGGRGAGSLRSGVHEGKSHDAGCRRLERSCSRAGFTMPSSSRTREGQITRSSRQCRRMPSNSRSAVSRGPIPAPAQMPWTRQGEGRAQAFRDWGGTRLWRPGEG